MLWIIILLVLGVPFGIGFLVGWLTGRNTKAVGTTSSSSYKEGYYAGRRDAELDYPHNAAMNEDVEEEVALKTEPLPRLEVEELSAEEQAKRKEQHDTKNINTTLYVASFLLVAAAALFIGAALPDAVKFMGVWLVVVLFYGGGLLLHGTVQRLRPAAVAFVGTGLALLPFTGLALYSYILPDGSLAWWITSGIGLIAFIIATLRLQSQVIAYLTMAFVFSLTISSLSVLQTPIIWYFVLLIAVSALCNLVAIWQPKLVPEVFRRPLDVTGQVLIPSTAIISVTTAMATGLTLVDLTLILAISALFYIVASLKPSEEWLRQPYLSAARALLSIAVLILAYDISGGMWSWVAFTLVVLGVVQQLWSIFYTDKPDAFSYAWIWVGFALQVLALIFWEGNAGAIALNLMLLMATSVLVTYKQKEVYFLSVGIGAYALLPMVVGYGVLSPQAENWMLSIVYLASAGGVMVANMRFGKPDNMVQKIVATAAYVLYVTIGLLIAITTEPGITTVLLLIGAVLVAAMSYLHKQPLVQPVAYLLLVFSSYQFVNALSVPYSWRILLAAIIAGAVLYALRWVYAKLKDTQRADTAFYATLIVLGLATLGHLWDTTTATVAAVALLAVAAIVAFEGQVRNRIYYYDAALIIASLSLQRLLFLAQPDLNVLVYTHWWVFVSGALALYYHGLHRNEDAKWRGIIALSILSITGGFYALFEGGMYQYIFLIEHAVLVVAGLLLTQRLVTIWGAVGVGLALLWMLRGYTYLWLALVGLGLIAFVIMRLLRRK